jgi:hypothetical protein
MGVGIASELSFVKLGYDIKKLQGYGIILALSVNISFM